MYKEVVISVIIVISIFFIDYITQKYTDKTTNDSIQDLNKIQQNIIGDNVNNKKVLDDITDKYDKWIKYHKVLAFYIEHNELEKVETNFSSAKSYIVNEKNEDAYADLEKTKYVLQHINDKYSINWENIF